MGGRFDSPLQVVCLFIAASVISVGLLFFVNAEAQSRLEHGGGGGEEEIDTLKPLALVHDGGSEGQEVYIGGPSPADNQIHSNSSSIMSYFEKEVHKLLQKFKFARERGAKFVEDTENIKVSIRKLWDTFTGAHSTPPPPFPSPTPLSRSRRFASSEDNEPTNHPHPRKQPPHASDFHRIRHAMKKLGGGGLDLSAIQRMILDPNPPPQSGRINDRRPPPPPPPPYKSPAPAPPQPQTAPRTISEKGQNENNHYKFNLHSFPKPRDETLSSLKSKSNHRLAPADKMDKSQGKLHGGGDHATPNHRETGDLFPITSNSVHSLEDNEIEGDDDSYQDTVEDEEDEKNFHKSASAAKHNKMRKEEEEEKVVEKHSNTYEKAKKQLDLYYDEYDEEEDDEEDISSGEGRRYEKSHPISDFMGEGKARDLSPEHLGPDFQDFQDLGSEPQQNFQFPSSTPTPSFPSKGSNKGFTYESFANESVGRDFKSKPKLGDPHLLQVDKDICYKTDDVLVVVAITCCLNFSFVLLIYGAVRWFNGSSKEKDLFQHLECEEGGDSFVYHHHPDCSENWANRRIKECNSASLYNFRETVPEIRRSLSHSMENLKYVYT